jgi:aryl carrier-like protein
VVGLLGVRSRMTQRYIDDYFEKEGIRLDYEKIVKNPGLRALAKLMLNSFWGNLDSDLIYLK